jgi:hypothetical protein
LSELIFPHHIRARANTSVHPGRGFPAFALINIRSARKKEKDGNNTRLKNLLINYNLFIYIY